MQEVRRAHLDEEAGQILAMFYPIHEDFSPTETVFRVNIYCNLRAFQLRGMSLVPEPGTPIIISFVDYDTDGATQRQQKSQHFYAGFVIEDHAEAPSIAFCAVVEGQPFWKFGKQKVSVTIQLGGEDRATMRQYNAFRSASKGLSQRGGGVDWDRFLLNCMSPDWHTQRNSWARFMADYPGQKEEFFQQAEKVFGLDSKQMEFTKQFLENDTGVSVLFGATGNGKSFTVAVVLMLYLTTNKKFRKGLKELGNHHRILVTATSDQATDDLLRKCIELDPTLGNQHFVRFKGGGKIGANISDQGNVIDIKVGEDERIKRENIENAYWHMMDIDARSGQSKSRSDLKEFDFIHDFHKTIASWSHDHPQARIVAIYNAFVDGLMKEEYSRAQRAKLFNKKKELERTLYEAYFHEVDAVFVPLIGASHPILEDFFEPTLLVIDDAAIAVLGDLLTPVIPHLASLQHVILAGDPVPVGGRALNKGQNEFFDLTDKTLMVQLFLDEYCQSDNRITELDQQHRMQPEIFGPLNQTYYHGKVLDTAPVNSKDAVSITAQDCFGKTFGAAYANGNRFGVDFSNPENASKNWRASKSPCNHAETTAIVDMVQGLLSHKPPIGGRQIEPRDILINTPFAGQETEIRVRLIRKGIVGTTDDNKIRVASPLNARGQEGNIQFISLCLNDPAKPLSTEFIADREMLNIMFSRAKHMQIVVGNFRPWTTAIMNKDKGWEGASAKTVRRYEFVEIIGSLWP
ncbi:hypothetical protein D6C77_09498 [Aureobasidium pullulans]|nr:hypothetical protein D6C77_09498 [Aureobasidium pullulans]